MFPGQLDFKTDKHDEYGNLVKVVVTGGASVPRGWRRGGVHKVTGVPCCYPQVCYQVYIDGLCGVGGEAVTGMEGSGIGCLIYVPI